MAAFDKFLARLGYVKLGRFGLALTPEGRVMSLRPAALDDGFGTRIVGWEDGDLAAMELAKWEPVPAPQRATASRVAVVPPPIPRVTARIPVVAAPAVFAAPPAPVAPQLAPVVAKVALPGLPVAPPPAAEPEEDWEWTIAIARARAAAEESELAAAAVRNAPRKPVVQLVPDTSQTDRMAAVAPPRAEPPVRPTLRVVPSTPVAVPVGPRATVIPIPKLPTLGDRRLEPVVRVASAQPRRFPKATNNPFDGDTATNVNIGVVDDDHTMPGITLPPSSGPLPSIRNRISSQR